MRKLYWILVSGAAVVIAIGGAVYYFFPAPPADQTSNRSNQTQAPSQDSRMLVIPAGNPLLTADANQFGRWVPSYPIRCGEIVFQKATSKVPNYSFCVSEIRKRVTTATGYQLSRDEVIDSRVAAHWREMTGAK
ncbi:hypothetical protein CBA19CS11_31990 [Caballeronia novacaledonica]|uniref:hypothetical protein n=1 Tax=Caballeronia novacaledonica TaxID=1544861 RepID=UPI001EE375A7|nr:hypothetical protein [Caballeronia novacaledonica]GJH13558.1 hypothetical protein CBA19CS11_31990 [Caballeronia novacaledonica]